MLIIQNVLLKWFDEWQKVNKKRSKWRDGSRNGIVLEVGLGRGALGSQANTIRQWPTTTFLPSFTSIRSAVLPEFTFLTNSGQKRRVGHFRRKFREERVNRHQLRLVHWAGEGWGYHMEETDVDTSSGLSTVHECHRRTDRHAFSNDPLH